MASPEPTKSKETSPSPSLSFTRLTPPSPPQSANTTTIPPKTIIFLHGLESCSKEYCRVTPHLSSHYDLILVDLPGHSTSRHIPFTLSNAITGLHNLITTHVKDSRAHIVGLSCGGFVALEFTRQHPECVLSLFCTGCAPYSGYRRWFMSHPRLLAALIIAIGSLAVTEGVFWWSLGIEPVPGLRNEFLRNRTMRTLTEGHRACDSVELEGLGEVRGVRVAIVAGARLDSVEDTRRAGRALGAANAANRAFAVREAIHLWDLQLPEVFADGVRAWVEGREMPKQFELLE